MRSDYAFIETDTTALVTAMIAAYEKMTGVTVQPASPERLFILWAADIIVQTRVAINYTKAATSCFSNAPRFMRRALFLPMAAKHTSLTAEMRFQAWCIQRFVLRRPITNCSRTPTRKTTTLRPRTTPALRC